MTVTHASRSDRLRSLFANRALVRINLAVFAASAAEHGGWLAVLLYAYGRGGVTEVSYAAAVLLVPAILAAPFVGTGADLLAPRFAVPLGLGVYALSIGLTAAVMFAEMPGPAVYTVAAVYSMAITFYRPAAAAAIPVVTTSLEDVTAANVGLRFAISSGRLVGPALAGLILVAGSPSGVLGVFAGLCLVSALGTVGVVPLTTEDRHEDDPELGRVSVETREGLRLLGQSSGAQAVIAMLFAVSMVGGALDVAAAGIAVEFLGRDESVSSLLITLFGAGSLLGAAGGVVLIGRTRLAGAALGGCAVGAIAFALVAGARSILTVGLLLALLGVGGSITSIAGRTMLEGLSPEDTLGRFFGMLESLNTIGLAAGGLVVGLATTWRGIESALIATAVLALVLSLVALPSLRSIDAGRQNIDPALLAMVRGTPIFAPLPAYTAEQLLQHLQPEDAEPDNRLIHRGADGERMLIVGTGSVVVRLRDGTELEHGPGSYVGEVALLTGATRNADVDAGPEGARVYWLDAGIFLTAVGAAPRAWSRVHAEADRRTARKD